MSNTVSNTVLIGELTLERAKMVLQGKKADIVYSDPPWGPGNLRYWRTMNNEGNEVNWKKFLHLFCQVVKDSTNPTSEIFVEMGTRWIDELAAEMASVGIQETQRFECSYRGGAKRYRNFLWHAGTHIVPTELNGGVKMTMGILSAVAKDGAIVFDPCCGKGMSAKCAIKNNMKFVGIELNAKRAAMTQKILTK
jgi:hypothetical protein